MVGVFGLALLGMALALSTALNRIEELENALITPSEVERDRQRLREEIEELRRQLETERTKNVALETALERVRAQLRQVSESPPSSPTEANRRSASTQ